VVVIVVMCGLPSVEHLRRGVNVCRAAAAEFRLLIV
jgi:hypothetical protein